MGMNDVKGAHEILGLIDLIHEGPAHVVDLFDEVSAQVEGTAVIVHPFDTVVRALSEAHPGVDVHFVALPLQGGRQLGHVDPYPTDWDRVQGFPRQQGNSHNAPPVELNMRRRRSRA